MSSFKVKLTPLTPSGKANFSRPEPSVLPIETALENLQSTSNLSALLEQFDELASLPPTPEDLKTMFPATFGALATHPDPTLLIDDLVFPEFDPEDYVAFLEAFHLDNHPPVLPPDLAAELRELSRTIASDPLFSKTESSSRPQVQVVHDNRFIEESPFEEFAGFGIYSDAEGPPQSSSEGSSDAGHRS